MKISELLGRPLISLADAGVEGILKDIIFDDKLKKARYLVLFDDKIEDEEKVIPVMSLFSIGSDALVIKNNDCVQARDSLFLTGNNPAGKTVFTTDGKVYGRITDILFDDKLNVVTLELDKTRTLDTAEIAAFSNEMLIVFDGKKVKFNRISPKPKEPDKARIVSTQPVPVTYSHTPAAPLPGTTYSLSEPKFAADAPNIPDNDDPAHLPQRIIGNYGFLLGRKVVNDIVNQRGDIIVRKDSVISPSTVEDARKYGRLVELTLHSLSL